jgi:hypothetical protein
MTYRLSKSRYQTGLQCPKALWLACHEPRLADPVGETQQHIFDTGNEVGALARRRFADGVLLTEDHLHGAEALATTARLMADPPPAVFEAAFEHAGVFVRPDVLVRVDDGAWDLYEVKSGTKVKPENLTDVAVQLWVLEGAGLSIRRVYLMHLDNTYVYPGGDYDLTRLFAAEDVTAAARALAGAVPAETATMLAMLAGPVPEVRVGRRCSAPYDCSFTGYCHAAMPPHPVTELPRIDAAVLDRLLAAGVTAVEDVPLDFPGLTRSQRDVCALVQDGAPHFVGDIASSLAALSAPIHFLDFETFMSALPLFPGTRPWQQLPFQWSDHIRMPDGTLDHAEFLYSGDGDPRRAFVTSLLEALGTEGSVVVYSSFENTQLRALADTSPEHAEAIGLVRERLFDLEAAVRAHVRHPDCMGRSSIKVVLPAMVSDVSYGGLSIAEGGTASLRYLRSITRPMEAPERDRIRADLLKYCATDTMAMVRLVDVLATAAG